MSMALHTMDDFMPLLSTTDIKKKLAVGESLLNYLADDRKSIECQDIGMIIDNVTVWLGNGNPKVVQNGLDIFMYLADRMGLDFRPYISTIIQPTIDRLGDNKESTREKAQFVLLKLMEKGCMAPQSLLDRLKPAFEHKNAKLREEAQVLLSTTLDEHGAEEMALSGVTPSIVKLLSDPSEKVRETAVKTLVDFYRHVGERLRVDLQRKHNVPQAKLTLLMSRFDEVKAKGDLLPMAMSANAGKESDETDRAVKSAPVKRLMPPPSSIKKSQFGPAKTPSNSLAQSCSALPALPRGPSSIKRSASVRSATGAAGAVDEETFITAFEDVPTVNLFSAKDLEEHMKSIKDAVGDSSKDWKQRIDSIKKLRSIIIADGMSYPNFAECMKNLQRPFEAACADLRSQVVREACITLAYLSQQLKRGFDNFGETVLNTLLNLIQNSAKVVATAGAVAVRFILQNTHNHRFVPIITATLNHKSKEIRRASCEYLTLMLQTWSTSVLQKHMGALQDAIKKGIADSDPDARAFARKSFWAFKEHFPEQAEIVLNSLDAVYKRSLMSLSNSGSTNNLNVVPRSNSVSPRSSRPVMGGTDRVSPGVRSTSAIDLQAAQRVKARMMYANLNRQKASLQNDQGSHQSRQARSNKSPMTNVVASPERMARTRTRVSGTSQSQPSSRSGSPSSRLSYVTYNREGESFIGRPRRLSGHGVTSTSNSREPSPHRSFTSKLRLGRNLHMSADRPQARPVMAEKMLQQSLAAESALADALTFNDSSNMRSPRGKGDQSDDSETSSICSERSMDSYRRRSDSFSWSGSQQRLSRDMWDQSIPKDIKTIIENCAHVHWSDKKDGLVDLQHYLAEGKTLSTTELRAVTDIFTKMFMDPHTKVFSLFLDSLSELIVTHHEDLGDWLYVLCARLLTKLGTDLLGSIQTKIYKTLDVIREYFPSEKLLPAVLRFLTDPTQTPNTRAKLAALGFITQIAETADLSALNRSSGSALARLLDWTSDVKSQDVRRQAHNAFIALYNLNPSQVTMILSELPQSYQEAALPLMQNHLRKSSGTSNPSSPGTPPPRAQQSPAHSKLKNDVRTEIDGVDDNLEEVYKHLHRTTTEIQNYEFERPTTSKDSGISNMADLEERLEGLNLTNSGRSSTVSSPTQRGRTNITINGTADAMDGDLILPQENNGYKSHGSAQDGISLNRPETLDNMLKTLQSKTTQSMTKMHALRDFQVYVREGDPEYIKKNFKKVLKTLLDTLAGDNKVTPRDAVLQTLIDMLKCPHLVESFTPFTELLVLKVINAYKTDDQKTETPSGGRSAVFHVVERCAEAVAMVLRPEKVIHLLSTIITTEQYPLNMGAIKMLNKVVVHWGRDAIEPHLSTIMPGLIKAYDDSESSVRKSAVFCMVAIHAAVGEDILQPHLSSLHASKLKLLNIYIQRAQQTNSQPASPRVNSKN